MTKTAFFICFVFSFVAKNVSGFQANEDKLSPTKEGVFFVPTDETASITWSDGGPELCRKVKIRAFVRGTTRLLMKPRNDADYQVFNCSNTYVNLAGGSNCAGIGSSSVTCNDQKIAMNTSRAAIFSMIEFDENSCMEVDDVVRSTAVAVDPFGISCRKSADIHSPKNKDSETFRVTPLADTETVTGHRRTKRSIADTLLSYPYYILLVAPSFLLIVFICCLCKLIYHKIWAYYHPLPVADPDISVDSSTNGISDPREDTNGTEDTEASGDAKTPKDGKAPKDAKTAKDAKIPKDAKTPKDAKAPKDAKTLVDAKTPEDARGSKDAISLKDVTASKNTDVPKAPDDADVAETAL